MNAFEQSEDEVFNKASYSIRTLEEEVRADNLCSDFLKHFYLDLVGQIGQSPEEASRLCYGASYFLKEFLIGDRRDNLFEAPAARIRQFAGNWYIIKNMEPNLPELLGMLEGVQAFYEYSARVDMVSAGFVQEVTRLCADLSFYKERIEDFLAIEGDGYFAWDAACPLND